MKPLLDISDDSELISSARDGDREAFNELVRKHRHRALGWVKRIVTDHHEVEDIVQDSLMNAFIRLGTLKDSTKFLAWLKTIVRNQAISNIRRSRLPAGTIPLSLLYAELEISNTNEASDPAIVIIHKEFMDNIQHWMDCLTPRERLIFNAHFFQQMPPEEISSMLQTSKNYVYKTISVSKQKMHKQRLGDVIDMYISSRSLDQRKKLLLPRSTLFGSNDVCPYSSCHSVYHILPYLKGTAYTLTEIMGFTGHAFRTTIERTSINLSGPGFYDWSTVLIRGFGNMGIIVSTADRPQFNPPIPDILVQAMKLIDNSLEQGCPALLWNAMNPEFAVVYGYDWEKKVYWIEDTTKESALAFDKLGQGSNSELFVIVLNDRKAISPQLMLMKALEMIIDHAEGMENGYHEFAYGFNAYEVWVQAFTDDTVDALGNAYSLKVVQEARQYAVKFLNMLQEGDWIRQSPILLKHVAAAEAHFSYSASIWDQLSELFPFPNGGDPGNELFRNKAAQLILQIKAEEEHGILNLKELLLALVKEPNDEIQKTEPPA